MLKQIRQFIRANLIWIFIGSVPVFSIVLFLVRFNSMLQFQILTFAAIVYLSLAFAHHHFDKNLSLEIMIEYVLIAVLVLIIVQGLIL